MGNVPFSINSIQLKSVMKMNFGDEIYVTKVGLKFCANTT